MGWEQKKESRSGRAGSQALSAKALRWEGIMGGVVRRLANGEINVKNGPCWALGARWSGNWILRGKGNPAR